MYNIYSLHFGKPKNRRKQFLRSLVAVSIRLTCEIGMGCAKIPIRRCNCFIVLFAYSCNYQYLMPFLLRNIMMYDLTLSLHGELG
jgi:hypothetical protein